MCAHNFDSDMGDRLGALVRLTIAGVDVRDDAALLLERGLIETGELADQCRTS